MNTVGVKFNSPSKVHYYNGGQLELNVGDTVIVDTDNGHTLATVTHIGKQVKAKDAPNPKQLKTVIRLAKDNDFQQNERNLKKRTRCVLDLSKNHSSKKYPHEIGKSSVLIGRRQGYLLFLL